METYKTFADELSTWSKKGLSRLYGRAILNDPETIAWLGMIGVLKLAIGLGPKSLKERRQVILVTHNANIAVLGDSELILPMCRENDCGKTKDKGSIDTDATRRCVLDILEGGPDAFLRRKEMYSH